MSSAQIAAGPCTLSSAEVAELDPYPATLGTEAPATGLTVDPGGLLGWPLRHVRSRQP